MFKLSSFELQISIIIGIKFWSYHSGSFFNDFATLFVLCQLLANALVSLSVCSYTYSLHTVLTIWKFVFFFQKTCLLLLFFQIRFVFTQLKLCLLIYGRKYTLEPNAYFKSCIANFFGLFCGKEPNRNGYSNVFNKIKSLS